MWRAEARMQPAPLPPNEPRRLLALRRFQVLDTLPEQGYDDITLMAAQICGTPIAAVSLVDTDRQWFKSRVGLAAPQTPRDVAFCAHTILEPDRFFVVPDAAADPRFSDNPLVAGEPGVRFYAGAALVTAGGEAVGALCVIDRVARQLTPHQEQALGALARQVMSQLELRRAVMDLEEAAAERGRYMDRLQDYRLRLEEALAQLAEQNLTDPLTGARNRLALTERLEAEILRHRRYGTPLALAMIDVDRFKEYNDRFGHVAGDEVLREIVQLLLRSARTTDVIARFGGEEFAVVLPETTAEGAAAVAERLREAVAGAPWPLTPVTISVGVAGVEEGHREAEFLVAAADRALYAAKEAGRNRVCALGV
jgi:diguanylate cyclase (GGDEF)-like protein